MRIDSSSIGMDSERSYKAVATKSSFFKMSQSKQVLEEGSGNLFGNLLQTDTESEEADTNGTTSKDTSGNLQDMLSELRAKINSSKVGSSQGELTDMQEQLRQIRENCFTFLMQILFPDRFRSFLGSSTGESTSTESSSSSSTSSTSTTNGTTASTTGSTADGTSSAYLSGSLAAMGVSVRQLSYGSQYYYEESESTSFTTQGKVHCADGREINFDLNVNMSRSFCESYEEQVNFMQYSLCDPLVINLNGNVADVSDQTFYFDLDADGVEDEISKLISGSGFLALDKNEDGEINDGSELFGTASGNGFGDLAAYDSDGNGFIDEGDEIFEKLKIFAVNENGETELYSLKEKGVGAIALAHQATDFSLTDQTNQVLGKIRNTGFFLYENGEVGTVQHVDMAKQKKVAAAYA